MAEPKIFLKENRERIEKNYLEQTKSLPRFFASIDEKIQKCTEEVALACKYLYAFMPYSDIGNYPFEVFLDYAENGVQLWKENPQIADMPEDIFLNYVLFHRVNEEEIAPCRTFFRTEIGTRIQGMNFREAALEVNYWCAEEATYHCTDDRTLSALSVYRRGNGRCGEESVFTVNALRSVGVPARQVYAPKWSHCDDNHAWVEIWCDGKWYFLGACEPEEILNKGWFTNASSRAMMIHSRIFDTKIPEGEVIGRDGMVTMLNELKRYAVTKEITVSVKDDQGLPVEGAEVSFEVLNYSEYAPIAEKETDENGRAVLTTGLGSLHISVRACCNEEWLHAEKAMNTETEDSCEICLRHQTAGENAGYEKWTAADMFAPHDAPVNTDMPDSEQKERGNKRLAAANAHREQKVRNWRNPECERFLQKEVNRIEKAVAASYREDLLNVLTEKDRTDCLSDVLEEHLDLAISYHGMMNRDTFVSYVLNPRVDDEVLQKYRREIKNKFSRDEKQELRNDPSQIWKLVEKAVVSRPEKERSSVITTPAGCLNTCTGSFLSKKILFVAMARTLGVPARLNPHDRSMEYMENEKFVPVLAKTEKNSTLILKSGEDTQWKYFQNWSIAKLENGRYVSLKLGTEAFENQHMNLPLESGKYRILTSNRLPNGNMFANEYHFEIQPGETKEIDLVLREADLEDMLENISMPEFTLRREDGSTVKASELTADGKHILAFLEEEKEPTEHILNEMMEQEEAFAGYAEKIIFVVRSKDALETPTLSKALKKLKNVQIYYDDFSEIINTLGRRMYVDPDKLPLIIVTNGSLNGIYATSGYNVGTGDMLLRLM
ncbi:transglutaminase domain-containing protein [Blautia difficilis]|uniref:Transglutaminase n=1 Tax=Blautia difficilis TaxID=2763027 RepID=A0ABR7IH11_9FIRM|nr:transglutaminase domain-containing protein [Blautia difficilis]MBC5779311.1 transglutaminase [Blautia difficilis]